MGDTFLGSTPATSTKHLFIVVSDPVKDPAVVYVVNVTTLYPGSPNDSTCLVRAGEHPFVKQDSWVNYARARRTSVARLHQAFAKGDLLPRDPLQATVLKRVQSGAKVSPHAPYGLSGILSAQGLP
jgi:hypothetical protein